MAHKVHAANRTHPTQKDISRPHPHVTHRGMDSLDYAFKIYICFFIFVIVYFCRWANQDVACDHPPPVRKARDVSPWRRR